VRRLDILDRLGGYYEETGDYARAAEYARRLIVLESWRESFHRLLMRNLAQAGQRKAALAQYERCRQQLAKELGIEPSARTRRLYEQLRDLDDTVTGGRQVN
jgi:DNA-binding SARP family transcriptional activator